MSIKSTHLVTRKFAKKAIALRLMSKLTDDHLAYVLEAVLGNEYYNFEIVSKEKFKKNKEEDYPYLHLDDLNDLPEVNIFRD